MKIIYGCVSVCHVRVFYSHTRLVCVRVHTHVHVCLCVCVCVCVCVLYHVDSGALFIISH